MNWQPPVIGSRPVAVLGAGVLGRHIACTFVTGGHNVHLVDPSSEAREAAIRYIDENRQHYTRNLPSMAGMPQCGSYAVFEDVAAAVGEAWLLVEAGTGEMKLSIDTFAKLDRAAPADCILGSSSSLFKASLTLGKDANQERRRVICDIRFGMPPDSRTVKLTTDGETEPAVLTFLSELLAKCGMLPATARKESAGLIVNRLWAAVNREILMILAEGVSDPAEVDMVRENIFQTRVLPCRLMDRIGPGTVTFVKDNYIQERGLDGTQTVDFLRENYVNRGRFGLKADKGGLYPRAAPGSETPATTSQPDVYFLDVGHGLDLKEMQSAATNGKVLRRDGVTGKIETLVSGLPLPDSIAISSSVGRMFWTNMGSSAAARDGSIMSGRLDGTDLRVVIIQGGVHTPKQVVVVESQQRLYFCDREGMSVHRVGFDGQNHEVLVQRCVSAGDTRLLSEPTSWCVGVAVNVKSGMIYWTQKGPSKSSQGRIFRAGINIPAGETASNRSDIELVFEKLPEPIDVEIDAETETLYWTDRGEHHQGCSLNRAIVGAEKGEPEIVARHFHEPIGLKLDLGRRQVFVADLGGSLYSVNVDSGGKTVLLRDGGCYTGITVEH